jgi:hypothetical protein
MAAKTIEIHGGPAKISRGFFVSGDLNYVKLYYTTGRAFGESAILPHKPVTIDRGRRVLFPLWRDRERPNVNNDKRTGVHALMIYTC